MEAQFGGRCELCECQIEEGDEIWRGPDDEWVHRRCAEDEGWEE